MAAVLLSPLRVWLAVALGLAAALALVDRHLALLAGLSLAAFLLGAGRGALAASVELPPNLVGQNVSVSGTVDEDPVASKASRRLIVHVDHVVTGAEQATVTFRIEATFYGMTPVKYGDLVLLAGEIQQPPRFDQFDYRAYLAEQGIAGVMPGARLVRVTSRGGDPLRSTLLAIRHAVVDAVDRALPEPQAALLLGVVFGYRAELPPTLQRQMVASGLIHIVVISGLKVSLLARIIQQAVGRFAPIAAPPIAAGAMAGYALLAGASAAALRAAAMGIVVVIAGRLHRDSHVFVSLALTAAVMLGLKPDLAGDVSFQLSFAGTMGIAAMTDRIAARFAWLPALLRDPFAATIAAEAATWPMMLANFHQLSLIRPIANALPPSQISTASPAAKLPSTDTTPTASRLVPRSASAARAPPSTCSRPRSGFPYLIQSLYAGSGRGSAGKRVPIRSPRAASSNDRGLRPEAITAVTPPVLAISAATTFERMPPEPSGDVVAAMSSSARPSKSVTSSTSRAEGSARGSAV